MEEINEGCGCNETTENIRSNNISGISRYSLTL